MSTPQADPITGHCLCGNVSYAIDHDGSRETAAICHCEDCRRSTGTAYSVVMVIPRASIVLKGEYKEYLTKSLSGQPAHRIFCPNCGSPVATFPDSNKDIVFVKAGTLSEDIQKTLTPSLEVFTRYRLPYVQDRFGLQCDLGA